MLYFGTFDTPKNLEISRIFIIFAKDFVSDVECVKKVYNMRSMIRGFIFVFMALCSVMSLNAQSWSLVWREDFGVAEDTVLKDFADPDKKVDGHYFAYNAKEVYGSDGKSHLEYDPVPDKNRCIVDGTYGIANSGKWAWTRYEKADPILVPGRDHTGNQNGAMLIVNVGSGIGEEIYSQDVKFDLCDAKKYQFGLYTASITHFGDEDIAASLTLQIFNKKTGVLIGEKVTGDIPYWDRSVIDPHGVQKWNYYSIDFVAHSGDELELKVINHKASGSGNDFVLDDISLFRYDEDVEVPEMKIEESAIASADGGNTCSYEAQFTVVNSVYEAWKKIDKSVYILWQKSSDDGLTWSNITDQSGVGKTKLKMTVDGTETEVFRVIVTASPTDAEAKSQAEYIALHDAPQNGCAYYSISNTISSIKPEPNCSYKESLRELWKEDFGVCDTMYAGTNAGVVLTPYVPGVKVEMKQNGEYVICSVPDSAIYHMSCDWSGNNCVPKKQFQPNNYNGVISPNDVSFFRLPEVGNAFAFMRMNKNDNKANPVFYKKTISVPLCPCKTFMFNASIMCKGSDWGTSVVPKLTVYDKSGTELASESVVLRYEKVLGKQMASVPFSVPIGYTGDITVEIALDYEGVKVGGNTYATADWLDFGLDDLSITICGEAMPKPKLCIDGDESLQMLSGFECNDETPHAVKMLGMNDVLREYPNAGFVWQYSEDDGKTWTNMTASSSSINYEGEPDILYRVVIGESKAVAQQVADNGAPTDVCSVFYITNEAGFKCKEAGCKDAVFTWVKDEEVLTLDTLLCEKPAGDIKVKVYQTNKANVDEFYIEAMDASNKWEPASLYSPKPVFSDGAWTLNFAPRSGKYKFYALNDTCKSDSFYINIEVREKLELEPVEDMILCEDAIPEFEVNLSSGKANKLVLAIESDDNEIDLGGSVLTSTFNVDGINFTAKELKSPNISIVATDGDCKSEPIKFKIEYEDIPSFTLTADDAKICKGNSTFLNIDKKAGTARGVNDHTYTISGDDATTYADGSKVEVFPNALTKYTVSAVGKYCKTPVTHDVSVDVELPQSIDLTPVTSPDLIPINAVSGIVCAPATVEFKTTGTGLTNWDWEYKEEGDANWTMWEQSSTDLTKSKSITKNTSFRVSTPVASSNVCDKATSDVITIKAEYLVNFSLALDKERVCENGEVELSIVTDEKYDESKVVASANAAPVTITNGKFKTNITDETEFLVRIEGESCNATDKSATAYVDHPLDFTASVSDELVCRGTDVTFSLTGTTTGLVWYSSVDGNTFEEFSMPADLKWKADTTRVFYVAAPANGACGNFESEKMKVEVERPLDDFKLVYIFPLHKDLLCKSTGAPFGYRFDNGAPSFVDVKWYVDDALYTPTDGTPSHFYYPHVKDTKYTVELTGKVCHVGKPKTSTWNIPAEDRPVVSLAIDNNTICEGGAFTLTPSFTNVQDTAKRYYQEVDGVRSEVPSFDNLTPTKKTTYYVSGGGKHCKSVMSEGVTLDVEQKIDFELSKNTPDVICEGTEVKLDMNLKKGDVKNVLFTVNGTKTDNTFLTTKNYISKPTETADYELVLSGDACEPVNKVVSINVEKKPQLGFTASKSGICEGDQVVLSVEFSNTDDLLWETSVDNKPFEVDGHYTAEQTREPGETTIYRVSTTGKTVCEEKVLTQRVVVEKAFDVAIDPVSEVCPGVANVIEANITGTPQSIQWESSTNGGAFVKAGTSDKISVSPSATTTYRVTLSGKYCDPKDAEVAIDVTKVPALSLDASSNHICEGDPLSIQTKFSTDNFDESSIVWSMKEVKSSDAPEEVTGIQVITPTPAATTDYTVTAKTPNGCEIASAHKIVTVDEQIVADIRDTVVCEGSRVKMSVDAAARYKYVWTSAEDGADVLSSSSNYSAVAAGSKHLNVKVLNGNCEKNLEALLEVVSKPVIEDVQDNGNRELAVVATGGSGSFKYDFGYGEQDDNVLADITYGRKYRISVKDDAGCKTDTLYYTQLYDIEVNPIFTPNGDGENDEWEIKHIEKYPDAKITVYNRFGKVVLKTTGADFTSWDGSYNGHLLPTDDYWYEIHIFEVGKTYTGHFTLLRD